MIIWTEEFATGSDLIDQQHRMWIANINHLEAMLTTTNPTKAECEFMVHLVEFLEAYAQIHFTQEEQCMEAHRCPAHFLNQKAHASYHLIFSNYRKQFAVEGFNLDLLGKLHATASLWIKEHILKVDIQLRPYIPPVQAQ